MADIPLAGREGPKKTVQQSETPASPELRSPTSGFELFPSRQGNELVAVVKMLESINRNLAFLAKTVYEHLNPQGKDNGRPGQ